MINPSIKPFGFKGFHFDHVTNQIHPKMVSYLFKNIKLDRQLISK